MRHRTWLSAAAVTVLSLPLTAIACLGQSRPDLYVCEGCEAIYERSFDDLSWRTTIASATILPVLLRRSELRENGASLEEIDGAIDAGYERGEFRLPEKLAVSYMLSAAQDLYGDDGRHHGQWVPHFMIYIPYLTASEIGGRGGGGLVVFREGKRDAALIIVAREFMEPNLRG